MTKLGRLHRLANLVRPVEYPPSDAIGLLSPTRAMLNKVRPVVVPTCVLSARFRKLVKRNLPYGRQDDQCARIGEPFGIPFYAAGFFGTTQQSVQTGVAPKENATESFANSTSPVTSAYVIASRSSIYISSSSSCILRMYLLHSVSPAFANQVVPRQAQESCSLASRFLK
jgi:hypothetical protein